jgi:hypothetical protein
MKDNTSSTFKARKPSMSMETETPKETKLLSGEDTMVQIRDGLLPILIKLLRKQPLDTRANGASISADHSTSDQDSQCRELLNVSVLTILSLRNGPREEKLSNSDSMLLPRPLEVCTGLLTFSQWKELTLDAEPSTQDGSNSSNGKLHSSETPRKKAKSWKSPVQLMLKIEISI